MATKKTRNPHATGARIGTLKLITRHGRQPWYFKTIPELEKEAKKKYKPANYFEYMSMQNAIEKAVKAWSSNRGKAIMFEWFTYPRAR